MKIAIKYSDLDIMLLCLTFYEPTIVPHYLYLLFKYVLLLYLLAKYFMNVFSEKVLYTFILLYGGVTILSTAVNHLAINTVIASFFYMIQILDIFVTSQAYLKRYSLSDMIKRVTIVFLFLCLMTDIPMLFVQYNFENSGEEYLIGSKFTISYLHCFTLALLHYLIVARKRHVKIFHRAGIVLFAVLSIAVSMKVNCTTGIVTNTAMLLLLMLPKSKMGVTMNGKSLIIAASVMNVLIFGSYSLLTNPIIQNLITGIFHKSATITGRLKIYAIIMNTIQNSLLIGHGYFNNVIERILDYGNAQNGVMKILIDSGVIGLALYTGIIYFGLNRRKQSLEIHWPFFAFLYAMIITSAVEINLTHMIVYFAIAIIFANSRQTETVEKMV